MTAYARLRARLRADEGTSLLELLVAMSIMMIFLGIFTGAIIVISKSQAKTTSITDSSEQVNEAFLWLDKNVRYAAAITTPGRGSNNDWYVELRNTTSGTEVCTQIRLDITTTQLQRRSWTPSGTTATGLTSWTPMGSGFTNAAVAAGDPNQPFISLPTATDSKRFQQLSVVLVAKSGSTNTRSTFTFPAINSTMPKSSAPVCQEAGRP